MVSANESPRQVISHAVSKTSSTKRATPDDKLKKRSSQISKELSDMVVYVQVIEFVKRFNVNYYVLKKILGNKI